MVAEMEGRLVGVTAAAVHEVCIQGQSHRLAYIHHGRVHPSVRRRGVGGALVLAATAWARDRGAGDPYWLIAPANEVSIAFTGRIGGRWPVDATFVDIGVSDTAGLPAQAIGAGRLAEAVELINARHDGEELFERLTPESMRRRLRLDPQYGPEHLRGVVEDGRLVAVAGLWDWGAAVESISVDATGEVTRSRTAAVPDWGYAPGRRDAFAALLGSLSAEARRLGRKALTLCEPSPAAVPDVGLPARRWSLSLVTPTLPAPAATTIRGIFADLVYV